MKKILIAVIIITGIIGIKIIINIKGEKTPSTPELIKHVNTPPTPPKESSFKKDSKKRIALLQSWIADAEHVVTKANIPMGYKLLDLIKDNYLLGAPAPNGSIITIENKQVPQLFYIVVPLLESDATIGPQWAKKVQLFQLNPISAQIDYSQRLIYLWEKPKSNLVRGLIFLHEITHLQRILFDPHFNGNRDDMSIASEVDAYTNEIMLFLAYGGKDLFTLSEQIATYYEQQMMKEGLSAVELTAKPPYQVFELNNIIGVPINETDSKIRQTLLHMAASFMLFHRTAKNINDEMQMRHHMIFTMFKRQGQLPSQKMVQSLK